MTCSTLRFLFASTLALSLTSMACNPREPAGSATATETDSSTSEGTSSSTTAVTPTTSVGATTTDGSASGSATEATTTTGTPTTTDTTVTTAPLCGDPEDQPINSACTDASGCGCDTDKCFVVVGFGGLCGECVSDDDCANGGCTAPNPLKSIGSVCNSGGPGEGCMSDEVCTNSEYPHCALLINAAPILSVSTCSQCKENADCTDQATPNCSPSYDVDNFKGQFDCVADGTVQNNEGCSLEKVNGENAGNKACMSGHCTVATFMSFVNLGVCGECSTDDDCEGAQTCQAAQIDTNNAALVGSVCK